MGSKLHRGRRSVFRKRHPIGKILLGLVGAAAIVAGGFFGTKYLMEHPIAAGPDSSTPAESVPESSVPNSSSTEPETPNNMGVADAMRGFYLPNTVLHDTAALTATLQQAASAGFNSVLFDMKDADGRLYFRSSSEQALQVNSFTEDAFSAEELKALFSSIRQAGLHAVARLNVFNDNAAARALPAARITPQGNPSWVWYDGVPGKGGKAWLNPYTDEARLYVIGLARELRDAGASAVLFDGVQFPSQTSQASYGTSADVNLSRGEILTKFITEARSLLGDDCPVLLSCTADSALGEHTQVYGGNPLTFGADVAVPAIQPAADGEQTLRQTVAAIVRQCATRIKVLPADSQPTLAPTLIADGLSAAELTEAVGGCADGGVSTYILYASDGRYDFPALKN